MSAIFIKKAKGYNRHLLPEKLVLHSVEMYKVIFKKMFIRRSQLPSRLSVIALSCIDGIFLHTFRFFIVGKVYSLKILLFSLPITLAKHFYNALWNHQVKWFWLFFHAFASPVYSFWWRIFFFKIHRIISFEDIF